MELAYPVLGLILAVIVSWILFRWTILGTAKNKSDNPLGVPSDEKFSEEVPEMTEIRILDKDGKGIEEFEVESHLIDWDYRDGVYLRFKTKDGKHVTYMLGSFSVKMMSPSEL